MAETKISAADQKDIEENKLIAALGYIFILCFIPLLFAKDSKFAQSHAKQGLVLFIVEVIFSIVDVVLIFIPILGWLTILIVWLLIILVAVGGIIKALSGQYWEIPLISDWAKKLNL